MERSYKVVGTTKSNGIMSRSALTYPRIALVLFSLVIVLLVAAALTSFTSTTTGRVSFDVSLKYQVGEPIDGDITFRIREGELIPADARVLVEYDSQPRAYALSDLILDAPIEGDFYAEGTSLTGSGLGYGAPGRFISYPELSFDVRVFDSSEAEDDVSGGDAPSEPLPEEDLSESDPETDDLTPDSPAEGESESDPETDDPSNPDLPQEGESEPGADDGSADESSGGESDEGSEDSGEGSSDSSDSGEDSGDGGFSGGITGAVLDESSYELNGETSHETSFTYMLESGQRAELVEGSVRLGDTVLPDSSVSLSLDGTELEVTTDYYLVEEGFGERFLGEYALALTVDAKRLDLVAVEGPLTLSLVSGDLVLATSTQTISVAGPLEPENVTELLVPSILLIGDIPTVRIAPGSSATFDLSDYFTGADSYTLDVADITAHVEGSLLVLSPVEGFKGARRAVVNAYVGDEVLSSNEFLILVSSGTIDVTTERERIVVGQPVRWVKNVVLDAPEAVSIELPATADNITITSNEEGVVGEVAESAPVSAGLLTGDVVIDLDVQKQWSLLRALKRWFNGITGRAIGDVVDESLPGQEITLSEEATSYTIEYYTPAPESYEVASDRGTLVMVSAPDDVPYTDVIVSGTLDASHRVADVSRVQIIWRTPDVSVDSESLKEVEEVPISDVVEETLAIEEEAGEGALSPDASDVLTGAAISEESVSAEVSSESDVVSASPDSALTPVSLPFDAYDTDADGYLDYFEWVAPHLSNQTFEIVILATHAEHLDENRTFVSDIFSSISALDGNVSEPISAGHFVRVSFERNLTSENDITVYPLILNGTPRIEIYENNGSEVIAAFNSLASNQSNRVILEGLAGRTGDVFDLHILDGTVAFDYIVDPTFVSLAFVSPTPADGSTTPSSSIYVNVSSNITGGSHYIATDFNRNILLWLRMDDINGTGSPTDRSSWSTNGSAEGGIAQIAGGPFGSAFFFDRVNDNIVFPNAAEHNLNFGRSNFTISAWIMTNMSNASAQRIISKRNASNAGYEMYIASSSNILSVFMGDNSFTAGVGTQNTANYSLRDNRWHHVVFVANRSGNGVFYIDGTQRGTMPLAARNGSIDTPTSALRIGRYAPSSADFFNGTIDEVIFFNYSLGSQEVFSLYNASVHQYFNNFTSLSYGTYSVTSSAVDSAGGLNRTTRTITLGDTVPPGVTINAPVNRTYTFNELPLLVNATLSSTGGTVLYTLTSGATNYTLSSMDNLTYNGTNTSLASGSYTLRIYANDSAGTRNDTTSVAFSFNAALLSGCATLTQANTTYTLNQSFSVTGSCMQVQANNITLDGNGFTLTGDNAANAIALNATSQSLFTARNIILSGFNTSIQADSLSTSLAAGNVTLVNSAVDSVSARGFFNVTGAGSRGGVIVLQDSNFSQSLLVTGGNGTNSGANGEAGSISITASSINLSGRTVGVGRGASTIVSMSGAYAGRLTLNYSSGFEALGTTFGGAVGVLTLVNQTGGTVVWGPHEVFDGESSNPVAVTLPTNLSSWTSIRSNLASLNATAASGLNTSANITFFGMPGTFSAPVILRDGLACPSDVCTNYTSLNDATVLFNVQSWLTNFSIGEDSGAPGINLTSPLNLTYTVAPSVLNYTVSGSGVQACWYTLDGGQTNTTLTCGTNATGLSPSQGSNTWRVYANNTAGNRNSSSVTFFLDSVVPTIQFANPTVANGSHRPQTLIRINVSVSESNPYTVVIRLYNTTALINSSTSSTSPFNLNFSDLPDGTYFYNATVNDSAGNTNSTETRTVILDNVAPTITFLSPLNTTYTTLPSVLNWSAGGLDSNLSLQSCSYSTDGLDYPTVDCAANTQMTGLTASQGSNTWYVSLTDIAGNGNNTGVTFFVDSLVPQVSFGVGTESNNSMVSRSNLFFNVTASDTNLANITLELYNGTSLVNRTTTTSSPLVLNVTGLSDGVYYYNATARDVLNNLNVTETRTVTIDTRAPGINFTAPTVANGTYRARTWAEVNVSVSETNSFSVTSRIYNSSRALINSSTSTSSSAYVNFTNLANGVYYYNATVNDTAGNTNSTETRAVILDTLVPALTIVYPQNTTYNVAPALLNWSLTELNAQLCQYSLDGGDYSSASCASSVQVEASAAEGSNTWYVTVSDSAGNSNSTTVTFTVDTTAPLVQFVSPTFVNNTFSADGTLPLNVTASDSALSSISVSVYNASGSDITGSLDISGGLSTTSSTSPLSLSLVGFGEGTYFYNATARDSANNTNVTETRTVTFDTTAPLVTVNAPSANVSVSQVTFNVTVNENADSARFTLTNGVTNVTMQKNGNRDFNFTNTSIADGTYTVRFYVNDSAGNTNWTTNRTFLVDTTRPLISLVSPTPANATYQSSTGFTVNVSASELNEGTLTFGLFNATGLVNRTSFTNGARALSYTGLFEGTYFYNASLNDSVGNINVTETRTLFIDATAPLTNLIAPSNNTQTSSATHSFNATFSDGLSLANATFYLWNSSAAVVNTTTRGLSGTAGSVNLTVTLPYEGQFYWNYLASDNASNRAFNHTNYTLFYDLSPPNLTFGFGTENSGELGANESVYVNITLVETNLANITFSLYNSTSLVNRTVFTSATTTFNWTTGLRAGLYRYEVNATDGANARSGTGTRTITLLSSCLTSCSETSACTLVNTQCYLSSGLCTGGICNFENMTLQNSTIYTLYGTSGIGNSLDLTLGSNLTGAFRLVPPLNGTFVFSGKNGTTIGSGATGGNAGVLNITVSGLFNRTGTRFIGWGGRTSASSGAGGIGGIVQLNYHGLYGSSLDVVRLTGGLSSSGVNGSEGSVVYVKDLVCPKDADVNNDGVIDIISSGDTDVIVGVYGNVSGDSTFNTYYDVTCDDVIDVRDLARVGFEFGRAA